MNLREVAYKVINESSSFRRKEGEKLFREGNVFNLKSKRIEDIYHIYGNVADKSGKSNFNSHIKIDVKNGNLIGVRCTCDEFENNSKYIKNYICKHIVATSYKFYYLAKARIKKNNIIENKELIDKEVKECVETKEAVKEEKALKINEKRKVLNLDIKLKYIDYLGNEYYECEFRVGEKVTYLIKNLSCFLISRKNKELFTLNKDFTYNPREYKFSKEDNEILNYIFKYINENKLSIGRTLKIKPNDLRKLLRLVTKGKKITLNYNYLDYTSEVIKKDIPISFTLKLDKDEFILRTKKSFQ
ncbi:hypothetical protein JCM1393_08820 [Clostridium carnis]